MFLYILGIEDITELYLCLECMIDSYQANIFNDDDFGALQCIFRLFKLLLQYHDPEVTKDTDIYHASQENRKWALEIKGGVHCQILNFLVFKH